ncbi:MAG: hypothetical protein ABIV63_07835, partial [Caldimonas sp.]
PERGIDPDGRTREHEGIEKRRIDPMNTPEPSPRTPFMPHPAQMRRWLELRHELAELHARLEYLMLMKKLRPWR